MKQTSYLNLLLLITTLFGWNNNRCVAQFTGHIQRYVMDYDWKFILGDIPNAESARYDDAAWKHLDVPHDWSIEEKWNKDNPSGEAGGYATIGIGWYRKTFVAPDSLKGKQLFLSFDGVMNHTDVWLNGQKVGYNDYGYIGFQCDLTPWIRAGKKNTIAVRVDNLKQASRWYTGSGIFRHVWLTVMGQIYVEHSGTFFTSSNISSKNARVKGETTLHNSNDQTQIATLDTKIIDPSGKTVTEKKSQITIPAHSSSTVNQIFEVRSPFLWSQQTPSLYKAISTVNSDQQTEDQYQTLFGIRSIQWDVQHGFQLNGKRIVIKGVCLHHDLGALGAAAYDEAIRHRLLILKSMDINAVRLSHNPYSPEMLQLCDSLGILVFDECFDKWYGFEPNGTSWKEDLTSFVKRDRNHPSIIIWSVGNEMTPHMYSHWGARIFESMKATVHSLDMTRPVTAALHPVRTGDGKRDAPLAEIAQYMDVISMNYQTKFYPRDHEQHPSQVLLGSETHVHQLNLNDSNQPNDGTGNQWFGTRDYVTNNYYNYVGGQFIWAGFDYLGEAGAWPSKGNRKNLIETTGFRKPFSFYIQSLYTDSSLVRIAVANPAFDGNKKKYDNSDWLALNSEWDWAPQNDSLRVYTFTNAPEVELSLNGKTLGKKRLTDYPNRIITWEVPNKPGVLKAVAFDGTKQVATHELKTTGVAVKLQLIADKKTLSANGEDVSFIEVKAVDANGNRVSENGQRIQFSIEGAGVIAGVDNGDLDSREAFQSNHRELRDGRCLVIVRSDRKAGKIVLTATAEGLKETSVELNVQQNKTIPAL
jgi:beta-galactosidase